MEVGTPLQVGELEWDRRLGRGFVLCKTGVVVGIGDCVAGTVERVEEDRNQDLKGN